MTIVTLRNRCRGADGGGMDANSITLARLLAMAALTAGATQYAEMIRRRGLRRAEARERAMFEEHGLHGLVRVLLADAPPSTVVRRRLPVMGLTRRLPDRRWRSGRG